MSVGRTTAVSLIGLQGSMVEVEADYGSQVPRFVLIGLPDAALGEARERVMSAAENSGLELPARKLTVNLSPAALPKHGSGFDLAIAVAALAAAGVVGQESVERVVHLGELGLDGRLRPISGVLPAVAAAVAAGHPRVMVPVGNLDEASLVPGAEPIGVASLRDAAIWHGAELEPKVVEPILQNASSTNSTTELPRPEPDLADVVGSRDAVEALIVAAAGGHHVFLVGPPGAGKTMLAERLPGLLPDLDLAAALEVSSIRSLSGLPVGQSLRVRPPFEAPHHTATAASLIGGGSAQIRPGAAARASRGVLFLDEAPEFPVTVLDSLRQPLESGELTIHRARSVASFPARFQLVLAANPCPCGQFGASDAECACTPISRRRYLARLSGPLLDRVDIRLRVPRVTAAALSLATENDDRVTTAKARDLVVEARRRASERWADTGLRLNSQIPGTWFRSPQYRLPRTVTTTLDRALERGAITMRGYDRTLRLAWTLADLAGANHPTPEHLGRALYLRTAH